MAGQDGRPGPGGGRGAIAALILAVVLALVLYEVGQAIVHHNAMQNCIDSGRRDCDTRLAVP